MREWIGKIVSIRTRDRNLRIVARPDGTVYTRNSVVDEGDKDTFEIVKAPESYGPDAIAFRIHGTMSMYLTISLYGDDARIHISRILSYTPLLPEHIPAVIDYAVGRETEKVNFEGSGFNYSPMKAEVSIGEGGEPGWLQVFKLEPHNTNFGILSKFGTYWRSQWWDNVVSQSSHCQGDELWKIERTT